MSRFDQFLNPTSCALGEVEEIDWIESSIGPFHRLPDYVTTYPATVVEALGELYVEYNQAFAPLVEANREWAEDYQFCTMPDGSPLNCAVQIDMIGLPEAFLLAAAEMSVADVRELLRGRIFEIENSLAMYQLLEKVCAPQGVDSFFKTNFRAALNALRQRHGKPIALLAVTQAKYDAMVTSEFGKNVGESVPDEVVHELTGFDRFFGPEEFREYLASNQGKCGYLLYARTSSPLAKLRTPSVVVDHPLLGDPEMRRILKAHAITFNVDAPNMEPERRINDTKGYMAPMAMAFEVKSIDDMLTVDFALHLGNGKNGNAYANFEGHRLSPAFEAFLRAQGVDPEAVAAGEVALRCKPLKEAYGCYGHVTGSLSDGKKFRSELRRNMRQRGSYVVQLEMVNARVTNATDGMKCTYIDRNFMAIVDGRPLFLGGFRSLLPIDSHEAQKGRIHGNGLTIWAEIRS